MKCLVMGLVALLLLSGVAVTHAQQVTPSPDGCEGFDAYLQANREATRDYWDANYRIRWSMLGDELRFRDPMTISSPEWAELAEHAEAAQSALKAIHPPPWLADYHQTEIEAIGLESAFAREVLKNGITVARPAFVDARSALYDRTEETRQRAGEICPDFARLFELPPATPAATPSGQDEPSELEVYIEQARATPTLTPTPAAGDPIVDGLLWVYVRVPAELGLEMTENGCMVRDEALDQSIWEGDPFVIADADGNAITEDKFGGTTRIRWAQIPWEPGTTDRGWTSVDGTRICRLQGRLFSLPYSPTYQVVFGERGRGPYKVTWTSIVANDRRLILDVDLTEGGEDTASSQATSGSCSQYAPEATTTVTTPLVAHDGTVYIDLSTYGSPFGATRVRVVREGHEDATIITVPQTTDEDLHEAELYANVDVRPGEQFRIEVETPPFVLLCNFVVHGATPG